MCSLNQLTLLRCYLRLITHPHAHSQTTIKVPSVPSSSSLILHSSPRRSSSFVCPELTWRIRLSTSLVCFSIPLFLHSLVTASCSFSSPFLQPCHSLPVTPSLLPLLPQLLSHRSRLCHLHFSIAFVFPSHFSLFGIHLFSHVPALGFSVLNLTFALFASSFFSLMNLSFTGPPLPSLYVPSLSVSPSLPFLIITRQCSKLWSNSITFTKAATRTLH